MGILLLGVGLLLAGVSLIFMLRQKGGTANRFIRFPGGDMLAPVFVLALLVFGTAFILRAINAL